MNDAPSTIDAPDREERSALLRLFEICYAATPAGAAAVHLLRAEQAVLDKTPSEKRGHTPSVFLLQAVPLPPVPILDDLRLLEKELREWTSENSTFSDGGLPTRTPHGLQLEAGDSWRVDIHPNGYVGFAAFSRPQSPSVPFFALGHDLAPLPDFGSLCTFVGDKLGIPSDAPWRFRGTVHKGPAHLLVTRSDRRRSKGVLPTHLVDISNLPTDSIPGYLKALLNLLESLGDEDLF